MVCAGFLLDTLPARGAPQPSATLAWAYPRAAPRSVAGPPPGSYHVPASAVTLSQAQITDEFNPPDWFPHAHPPAPPIVAQGHGGGQKPCATCHLLNGAGFLGVPDLAGLPMAYIIEQVHQFRNGMRRSAEHDRPATGEMIGVAVAAGDADLASASAYYAALPRVAWCRVVETQRVPASEPNHDGWLDLVQNGGTEPIGGRIIEVAEDTRRMMWLSDPHSGIVDYVPLGSLSRGGAIVRGDGAGIAPCAACHGVNLRGRENVPALAGRSAAYLARALWDIRTGARRGVTVALMRPVAASLNAAQVTDAASYLASLKP